MQDQDRASSCRERRASHTQLWGLWQTEWGRSPEVSGITDHIFALRGYGTGPDENVERSVFWGPDNGTDIRNEQVNGLGRMIFEQHTDEGQRPLRCATRAHAPYTGELHFFLVNDNTVKGKGRCQPVGTSTANTFEKPTGVPSPMPANVVDDLFFIAFFFLPLGLLLYMLVASAEARGALWGLPVQVLRCLYTSLFVSTYTRSAAYTTRLEPSAIAGALQKGGGHNSYSRFRTSSTRTFPQSLPSAVLDDEMLKRELDRHNNTAAVANKRRATQLTFQSSAPLSSAQLTQKIITSSPPNATRPLGIGTGNVLHRPTLNRPISSSTSATGLKRSASGLAKALSFGDGFELPGEEVNSKCNPIVIDSPKKTSTGRCQGGTTDNGVGVYFDENDFDSDLDFDIEVEDPGRKGQVKYPELSPERTSARPTSRLNLSPSTNRKQESVSTSVWNTSFEQDQQAIPPSAQKTPGSNLRSTPASQQFPWSSSPLEHYNSKEQPKKMPLWDPNAVGAEDSQSCRQAEISSSKAAKATYRSDGRYQKAPAIATIDEEGMMDEEPRPVKRRTIPWAQKREGEEGEYPVSEGGETTPASRKSSTLPWNTSASAIKAQQKQLRQANKKLIKEHEPSPAERSAALTARKSKQLHTVFLSEEQKHVLDLVTEKKQSVFFTGSAGTGKSVLLREIISALRKKFAREPDRVAVTASTGLAACNIGGVTLHSFAGIGLGKEDVPTLCKKIRRNQKAKHRWMRTKVLIIDEVSMVDGELFDKLEEVARILRNNGRPFGGIQLVITGDFFQLPPVPEGNRAARFAFEAATWSTSIDHTIALHHVFRQKDPVFAGMLNEMREGRLRPESIARFRSLNRPITFEDSLEATELFPTRTEVDRANAQRMANLQGELHIYEARDGGSITDKAMRDKLLQNCMAPEVIQLKKGAQVMLIKNIDDTLVNGSLGKVIGFMNEATFDNYQQNEEAYYATQQNGADEAASRHNQPAELSDRKLRLAELAGGSSQAYPVVRFAIADGSTRDLLCQRESWKVELPNGEVQASRHQVPLILAWALSIHKAQGQTLERVKVDLGKVFEKGQAYVALSRATSMKGLQIVNFQPGKVMAHEKVRKFYENLTKIEKSGAKSGSKSEGHVRTGKESGPVAGTVEDENELVTGDRYLTDDFEFDV
ncbi:uncharacterized protein PV09_08244 [Verruconis gallopava]|uniref:ATP-dependent DNA helicase PIF1 n=1 Tax=Verruconis gallopava TaxID=253628 RepID=A0A0D2AM31_9PEZI|nr:uncharacterized protein PV09_08244 [Verruconis gallopava]KIW00204.1 hypothetical protein PV09_08244 [Verruconis gallopava]